MGTSYAARPVSGPFERLGELTQRVAAEYGEMPGLSLTLPQAARLWGLDRQTCGAVFHVLSQRGVLRRTPHGRYIRM